VIVCVIVLALEQACKHLGLIAGMLWYSRMSDKKVDSDMVDITQV